MHNYTLFVYIMQVLFVFYAFYTLFFVKICIFFTCNLIYYVVYCLKDIDKGLVPIQNIHIYMEAFIMQKEKVVLAYSGGLDTTAIIPWLTERFNYCIFSFDCKFLISHSFPRFNLLYTTKFLLRCGLSLLLQDTLPCPFYRPNTNIREVPQNL